MTSKPGKVRSGNAKHIEDCMRSGKVRVLFNSNPAEVQARIRSSGRQRQQAGDSQRLPLVLAGSPPPNAFLKKIGVGFGARDLTLEASREAKSAAAERKQLAQPATAPSR